MVRRPVRRREVEVVGVKVIEQSAQVVVEHVTEVVLVGRVDVVVKVAEQPSFGPLCGVDAEVDYLGDGERRAAESTRRQLRSRRSDRSGRVDDKLDFLGGGPGRSGEFNAEIRIVLVENCVQVVV